MEILKDFGFEPTFFFAQIINFLIIAFILKRFLYKPVLATLSERKSKIEKGLKDAEKASLELAKAEERKDEIIKKAAEEAEKIIEETKKSTEELRETLTLSAKTEAEKIISEAKVAAEEEFDKSRKQAENIALTLSQKILDKLMTEMFTKEEKAKIMARNIKKLDNLSS
jgi:F-type H+-transporting ATPase subunit b